MKLIAFDRQAATLAPKKIVKSLHRNKVLKNEKNISWNHFLKIIVVNFTNFWHIRKFNVNIKKMYFIFQHYSPLQLRVSNYCRCTCSNRINECNFTKKSSKKKTGEQPKWRHFSCNRATNDVRNHAKSSHGNFGPPNMKLMKIVWTSFWRKFLAKLDLFETRIWYWFLIQMKLAENWNTLHFLANEKFSSAWKYFVKTTIIVI